MFTGEPVLSNLGRFVVVIWCFVVLILTQSYTASLTSLLTVEKLRPSFTNVNELLKNGEIVGYPKFSFVLAMLKELKFKQSNLKMYHSMANLEELFANGEISAAFDESPYLKLFVARHCSNYTMVGPTYKTNGFGFVSFSHSVIICSNDVQCVCVYKCKLMHVYFFNF